MNFVKVLLSYIPFTKLICSYPRVGSRKHEYWGHRPVRTVPAGILKDMPVVPVRRSTRFMEERGCRCQSPGWSRCHFVAGIGAEEPSCGCLSSRSSGLLCFQARSPLLHYSTIKSWHPPRLLKAEVAILVRTFSSQALAASQQTAQPDPS